MTLATYLQMQYPLHFFYQHFIKMSVRLYMFFALMFVISDANFVAKKWRRKGERSLIRGFYLALYVGHQIRFKAFFRSFRSFSA